MPPTGVLLMTFGSPAAGSDVPAYLRSVRRGAEPAPEVVAEFVRRYQLVGGSPLVAITRAQADALARRLDTRHPSGAFAVETGMLHSDPSIAAGVAALADRGVTRVIGVIMSPQYSPVIMAGYDRAFGEACAAAGVDGVVAGPWHLLEPFIETLAIAVTSALAPLSAAGAVPPVVFTAHSLPREVVDRDGDYITQLHETATAVATRAGLSPGSWEFAYQSAGHTQQEWLTPDFKDLLPRFRAAGHDSVLIVPVQFLADHLEILYDLDIAGVEAARECGVTLHRTAMPNTAETFIDALAAVAEREEIPARG